MIGRVGYDLACLGLRLVLQLWPLWLCWFAWSLAAGLYDTALLAGRDVPGPLARPLFGYLLDAAYGQMVAAPCRRNAY